MMDILRNWLLGITAAAIILALADSLMPDGAVRKVGKLTGGLLLIVVTLHPVLELNFDVMAAAIANYKFEVEEYSDSLEVENERLKKIIIEDRICAYIQNKAIEAGIECSVDVSCGMDERGTIFPKTIVVYGELTQEQIDFMQRTIEGEVAISPENQRYERTTE